MKKNKEGCIVFALAISSLLSCEDSSKTVNQACNTDTPLEDIQWLQELKESYDRNNWPSLIIRYNYKQEDVDNLIAKLAKDLLKKEY